MDLRDDIELANARKKLREFEALHRNGKTEAGDDEELREASRQSVQRLINQLKEQIARFKARSGQAISQLSDIDRA